MFVAVLVYLCQWARLTLKFAMAATSKTMAKWLKTYNERDDFPFMEASKDKVFCKACERLFTVTKKSALEQHVKSDHHKKNTELKLKRSHTQAQLEDVLHQQPKKMKSEVLGRDL